MNLILHVLTYFFLVFSIIGIGLFFVRFFKLQLIKTPHVINFGYLGIYGTFILTTIGLTLNLIFPLNLTINFIIILFGFIFFLISTLKNLNNFYTNKFFFISLIISTFSIFFLKNHDDFPYYHLAFIDNLSLSKLEFGLGNFDIAFNHFSSLFFLNALFKNYITKDYYYFVAPISILVFSNSILLSHIFNLEKFNLRKIISLFIFIFINCFFYRIAEHGTDRSAQILIFLLFSNLVLIFNENKENHFVFEFVLILLTLVISLKSFYFLYSIFLIILYFKYYSLKDFFKFLQKYKISFFSILIILLILFYNFAYSGCFIYPISFTCPADVFWGYGLENVKQAEVWYELWSKGGAGPNFRVLDPINYIVGINWLNNWYKVYFLGKVSDSLLGISFIVFILYIFFRPKKILFTTSKLNKLIYTIILIYFFIWFFKNPSLRYGGGYVLISLILFLPFSVILDNNKFKMNKIINKIKILVLITFLVFMGRNIKNTNYEIKNYNYLPVTNPHYKIDESFKRIKIAKNKIFKETKNCENENFKKAPVSCRIIAGYIFYYRK